MTFIYVTDLIKKLELRLLVVLSLLKERTTVLTQFATLSSHTPFPNLFSVHYKFPENEAILRKLIILDKLVFNILECLMNNIEKRIDIYVEESDKLEWGKPLKNMPLFTIK